VKQPHKIITRRVALVDSSAILALLDGNDGSLASKLLYSHHNEAIKALDYLLRNGYRLFMTNFILAEAHALILSNLGHHIARRGLSEPPFAIVRVEVEDEEEAVNLILRFQDKEYSLTDAISFVIMEHLNVSEAFAYDRHFQQYGFQLI
jgi:predicted nucleic acid-binding protein